MQSSLKDGKNNEETLNMYMYQIIDYNRGYDFVKINEKA